MNHKFIGSTIALIIGILLFVESIGQLGNGNAHANPLAGEVMILGSLAYKSLKKRTLGIIASTRYRQVSEILALVLILALVVLQREFKMQLYTDPVPNLVIPLWVFIAYSVFLFKKPKDIKRDNNRPYFTVEQLNLMKELVDNEIESIRTKKQEIINEAAKRGDVISTDNILQHLDELKSSYRGPNPEQYFAEIDKIKRVFREKYGTSIPVDEAYTILTEYEQKYGML